MYINYKHLLRVIEEVENYAILFMDRDGYIKSWNTGAQKIKGYTTDEIIGKNFRCFYTDEDIANGKPDKLLNIALTTGRAYDEGWRVRKDGTKFWGSITITVARDETGQVIGFGKLTRDLTERKIAQQVRELEIKNKELEQFNYIASHDLQEPLRTVSNYVQILEEDFSNELPDEAKEHLNTIKCASNRMSVLVHTLLDFSRIGRNEKLTEVNCNELIDILKTDLQNLIKNNNATIIADSLPTIKAYKTELGQLFQNLITNAIKFKKKDTNPEVKIGCKNNFFAYEFHVKDNGIGIEPKYHERIFNIFQKLNKDEEFEGYGIGLAHCKKIVEMHRGKIWVDSELNKGTTFKFTISNL